VQGLRVGSMVGVGLSLFAFAHVAVASTIVSRAAPKAPAA
jgi:hypothetical protein